MSHCKGWFLIWVNCRLPQMTLIRCNFNSFCRCQVRHQQKRSKLYYIAKNTVIKYVLAETCWAFLNLIVSTLRDASFFRSMTKVETFELFCLHKITEELSQITSMEWRRNIADKNKTMFFVICFINILCHIECFLSSIENCHHKIISGMTVENNDYCYHNSWY